MIDYGLILAVLAGALLFGAGATAGALLTWRLLRGMSPVGLPKLPGLPGLSRIIRRPRDEDKPEAEKRKYPKLRV